MNALSYVQSMRPETGLAVPLIRSIVGGDSDRRQQLRMRRFFMSLASYSMWYLIAVASWKVGLLGLSGHAVLYAGIAILLSQLVFYALIRTRFNLRFHDPSLTMAQIIVGLAWALFLIAITREIRGIMLTVYMVTLLFGIFALDKRQFLVTGLIAYLGYAGLVMFEQVRGMDYFSNGYYIVSIIVLSGILLWTTTFGSYVSNLRYKLQIRNEELEKVLGRMRDLADHDDLTGLLNRRVITDSLRQLKARADRTGEPFSVCIMDLDHFKNVNDEYGHLTGDRALTEFSQAMSRELREMDIIASNEPEFGRYGGEEFILLLPGTDARGAEQCAERLRQRQEAIRAATGAARNAICTLSAGVSEYVPGEDIESILRRADRALYRAKREGRNRVVAAPS